MAIRSNNIPIAIGVVTTLGEILYFTCKMVICLCSKYTAQLSHGARNVSHGVRKVSQGAKKVSQGA